MNRSSVIFIGKQWKNFIKLWVIVNFRSIKEGTQVKWISYPNIGMTGYILAHLSGISNISYLK